jgi:hypothetical protein
MKALVIRDLRLKYQQFATEYIDQAKQLVAENNIELAIVAGNISQYEKRSILLAEEVANAINVPVVYTQGLLEMCNIATLDYAKNGVKTRVQMHQKKTNVWWPDSFEHPDIEFRECTNWPIIDDTLENFRAIMPGRWLSSGRRPLVVDGQLFDDTFPFPFTLEEFNAMHLKETPPTWSGTKKKVLLTSIATEGDVLLTVQYHNTNQYGADIEISASGPKLEVIDL